MRVGIVTTWFERGAAIVSKQFEEVIQKQSDVYIYARGGEERPISNPKWHKKNVTWGKEINSPFALTTIVKNDFINWLDNKKIELVIFNEQQWWLPMIWCKEKDIKTIAYIDYYTRETIPLFNIYDALICNTRRHFSAFRHHPHSYFIPWGTSVEVYLPSESHPQIVNKDFVTFFHSAGMSPFRKGTDMLIQAFSKVNTNSRLIIHSQVNLLNSFPQLKEIILTLQNSGRLEIIQKTVPAPGLYTMGDIYVYPSRLDGIGLTIAEALSCGLGVVVPNNAPMNEFIDGGNGLTTEIEKFFSREDGYYWPICEVNIEDLQNKLEYLAQNKEEVVEMKRNSRIYALEKLDWDKNSTKINKVIRDVIQSKTVENNDSERAILIYENKGLKKYNKYFIKYYYIIKLLRRINKIWR